MTKLITVSDSGPNRAMLGGLSVQAIGALVLRYGLVLVDWPNEVYWV
jgi:hypothetical protein